MHASVNKDKKGSNMKKIIALLIVYCVTSAALAAGKASVFIDKFIPNEDCRITAGELQILHDRIVGNVIA